MPERLIRQSHLPTAGVDRMRESRSRGMVLMAVLTTVMMVSGCIDTGEEDLVEPGETRTDTEETELGNATKVKATVRLGAGVLDLGGGAQKLMEGTFRYNIDQWKQEIAYFSSGDQWELTIEQPNTDLKTTDDAFIEWDIHLNNEVPLKLFVNVGAGNCNVDAGDLNLTFLDINTGSGNMNLDLRGFARGNLSVNVNVGSGKADMTVPSNIGVKVIPIVGAGNLDISGFMVDGTTYTNTAYGTTVFSITIDANVGAGDLTVNEG